MFRILVMIVSTLILYLGIFWFLMDLAEYRQEEIDKVGEDGDKI